MAELFNIRAEAANMHRYDCQLPQGHQSSLASDILVKSHARDEYRVSSFVSNIVSESSFETLQNLFFEMRDVNELFVGMRSEDAMATISLSEDYDDLKERLLSWGKDYAKARMAKPNCRDKEENSKLLRLWQESKKIFDNMR
jgi:hypothetical protein